MDTSNSIKFTNPKKSLGQNFLIDIKIVEDFIDSCNLNKDDFVIEIGAGTGTLTKELAKYSKHVIALEFDSDLIAHLKTNLGNFSNIQIINTNALSFLENLKQENYNYKIVGAIPYNISSPLLHKIVSLAKKPELVCLVVQYEVAQKICSLPPKASYLSIITQTYGVAKIIKKVPPNAFFPAPKVISAIIKIEKDKQDLGLNILEFSKFLHEGFKFPKKKIKNSLSPDLLIKAGINPNLRPGNLTLDNWKQAFLQSGKGQS